MKFKIVTLGCKVNSYESEYYSNSLIENGFEVAKNNESPDLVIINTCSVTSTSDGKDRQMIHREHKLYPNAIILVIGCYAQVSSEIIKNIDGVNIVIGSKYKDQLINIINNYIKNRENVCLVESRNSLKEYEEISVKEYSENTRAFIKIQDGCDNFCSYCLIPLTRGPSRSRKPQYILEEIRNLVKRGYKEIVLTGIDTAWYGTDLINYNFISLLKDIIKENKELERIRISSIEEREITDEFIELMKDNPVILRHLHIPLQSGSKTVLERMHRKYSLDKYEEIVNKLRLSMPDISLTTDVIVGFPGESNEEFNETYNFIKKIKFSQLHVFPYSRRSKTLADTLPNQIKPEVKKERVSKLIELGNELSEEYIGKFKNKTVKVLFETLDKDIIEGHAENYFLIRCKGSKNDLNKIKDVDIIKTGYPYSEGEIKNG